MSVWINTFILKIYFLLVGIKFGKNLMCVSFPRILFLDCKKSNLIIGDKVVFNGKVEIKIKSLSKIILGNNVKIDQGVRLIASNGSQLEIKHNSKVMFYSQINAGEDITIGPYSGISSNTTITTSAHNHLEGKNYIETNFTHKKIYIGKNVQIGTSCFISPGSHISDDVIVAPLSYVLGKLESKYIYKGNPALKISPKY